MCTQKQHMIDILQPVNLVGIYCSSWVENFRNAKGWFSPSDRSVQIIRRIIAVLSIDLPKLKLNSSHFCWILVLQGVQKGFLLF